MPGCSSTVNKRGVKITFMEEDHSYTSVIDGKEIRYVSGTTFVDSFFPEFDPTGEITRRCARREGLTESEMRKRWRDKADRSCVYGTKVHECMEDRLLGRPLRNKPSDDREKTVFQVTESLSNKILPKVEILGIEKIIFDENLKIAGTMDLFVRAKKDGKLWILDHKSNEKIETDNRYGNFALDPISEVPDNNFSHYTLQLSLYQYLLRKSGYIDQEDKVGMALFHITERGVKTYVLDYMENNIEKMVEYYQKNGLREKKRQ